MKRKLIIAVVVIAAVVGVILLVDWMKERALDRADDEGYASVNTFFKLIGDGTPDASKFSEIKAELGKMEEIATRCRDDVKQLLLLRRMDGAFIVGDFDLAVKLMDECTERSAAWREGAKAKIRAHAAMRKGDNRKAVAELDAFVQMVIKEPDMDMEQDPSTNEEWTREMIVARNYFRLAKLSSAYDRQASSNYTARAKEYVEKAKKQADGDVPMLKTIERIVIEADRL